EDGIRDFHVTGVQTCALPISSQMKDALLERTNVKIKANTHKEEFVANGEVVKFDGFLKVYLEGIDDEDVPEEQEGMLPALKVGRSEERRVGKECRSRGGTKRQ